MAEETGNFRRWARAVRRQVRLYVGKEHAFPPMVVWTASNVRAPGVAVEVGAGEDAGDVAGNIRDAIVAAVTVPRDPAAWAAFGRTLHEERDGERVLSTSFGLIVVGEHRFEAWEVTLDEDLELLGWEPGTFGAAPVGELMLSALRQGVRDREEAEKRLAEGPSMLDVRRAKAAGR